MCGWSSKTLAVYKVNITPPPGDSRQERLRRGWSRAAGLTNATLPPVGYTVVQNATVRPNGNEKRRIQGLCSCYSANRERRQVDPDSVER
jgi:hypothetical protein